MEGMERGVSESMSQPLVGFHHLTWTVFQDQPDQGLGHYDLVQAGNMGVDKLAVVVNLPSEVRVVLVGRLEDDLKEWLDWNA